MALLWTFIVERAEGERGAGKARKGEAKVRLSVNGPELVVKK
jgi:hypothetical protein